MEIDDEYLLDVHLVLTSDFPSTRNQAVLDLLRRDGTEPKIAWIPPSTDSTGERFLQAQRQFSSYGLDSLECCDIDDKVDQTQLSHLDHYDVLYLSGGDPLKFRRNILRSGLAERLRQSATARQLIVAASGGSLQLTKSLSLFRLQSATLDEVFCNWNDYEALGVVGYELLPHLNRFEPEFLEKVRRYSERVDHAIIALSDGAAVLHRSPDDYRCVGNAMIFVHGTANSDFTAA